MIGEEKTNISGVSGIRDQAPSAEKLAEIEGILESKFPEPVVGEVKVKTDYEKKGEQALKRALNSDRT